MKIHSGIDEEPFFLYRSIFRKTTKLKSDSEVLDSYRVTLTQYERWLAGVPEVARVLENLRADVEGEALNGGTPHGMENCTITGLRQQVMTIRNAQSRIGGFQARVRPWLLECFGSEIAADKRERNHRFLEESVELVQACGCTQVEAHQLVNYVFNRPLGERSQEVGGVMVTLAALCLAHHMDMHEAGEAELARVWPLIERIRAKQAAKPKHSPLPGKVAL